VQEGITEHLGWW